MNRSKDSKPRPKTARDEKQDADARAWVLHYASGQESPEKDEAFSEWLSESDQHRRAFDKARLLWEALADIEGIEDILEENNTVTRLNHRRTMTRRILIGGSLAAGLVFAAGIGTLAIRSVPPEAIVLTTKRGEIKTYALSDGSTITLGGASTLRGAFTRRTRNLELVEGNAYFDIARDADRPLTVDGGEIKVHVLGTRFDIKKRTDWVSVSVDNGHVRVTTDDVAVVRDLVAGEKIVSSSSRLLDEVQPFDVEKELSWRSGRLSFTNTALRDIVAEINQYSDRPVRLSPGAPADMRLTLSFTIEQIDQVLQGLDAAYPIHVQVSDKEILIFNDR